MALRAERSKESAVSVEPQARTGPEIENLLAELRTFPPDPAFVQQANVTAELYDEAQRDPEAFWELQARERISWSKPFETTLEWDLPFAKWFVGGELNVAYNCVDRHVEAGPGGKGAYPRNGGPRDPRDSTYTPPPPGGSEGAEAPQGPRAAEGG